MVTRWTLPLPSLGSRGAGGESAAKTRSPAVLA